MNIKTFYARPSVNRERYKAGILIEFLPDNDVLALVDKIANALKAIGIGCTHFIIPDTLAAFEWCKAVGVNNVNAAGGIFGLWILDKDPETCIQVVHEVVREHINNA
jgi:hypothetical protein